ncbi:MFS transporter [Pilimelia anulata]|uniref:MFS transporter n=1 Tax=Pilimelia anulata TaxID=53371 RepID=A0A8J3FCE5_9ACTN|nr:peptide MFS transporter [Pilimelia anulata]GGJ91239.1 MFS transporter [Pilimelia anulata]
MIQPTRAPERTFLGQPRALANLFGLELWERFSFYGMQGILVLYLYFTAAEGGLGIDRATATSIAGAYGGTVYLSTILGAWLADRLLGRERVLFASAWVVMAGHIALAVLPGLLGIGVGLVLVALGSGGVKATATSLVGTLYPDGDTRRDAGFSIFYMGINIGALLGPLLTGWLQQSYGFHLGFGVAAVGMALGLIQYRLGRRRIRELGGGVDRPLPRQHRALYIAVAAAALSVLAVLVVTGVITADRLSTVVVGLALTAAVAYFAIILGNRALSRVERRRVLAFIPLFIASAAFWALFQQQFTVLPIYVDERLDRHILGGEMPIAWVNSINPIFVIVFAGVLAALWTRLGPRQPSAPLKFALGTIVMGAAFLLFIPLAGGGANSVSLLPLVGILFFFTLAELLLSPVGLSAATTLAPAAFRTQMVALFFLSVSLGSALAGTLAGSYSADNEVPYFGVIGAVAIALGLVLAAISRPIRHLMSTEDATGA